MSIVMSAKDILDAKGQAQEYKCMACGHNEYEVRINEAIQVWYITCLNCKNDYAIAKVD